MPVNSVNNGPSYTYKPAYVQNKEAEKAQAENTAKANTENAKKSDNVDFSTSYTTGTNNTYKTGNANFKDNRSAIQMKNDIVRSMAQDTISKQGKANKTPSGYTPLTNFPEVTNALQAAEATSEGKDYWSADATAERIFTFAKTLAGEDDSMFQKMKDAFLKGFSLAEGNKRGSLPGVSYETKDKVLAMFDEWEAEINNKSSETAEENTAETGDAAAASSSNNKNTTTVYGREYGGETVPTSGAGKYSGHSGKEV